MVQLSALATELAGLLELAIAFGPDLGLVAEELVAWGDVADGAVQAVVVVVVDAGGDGGAGAIGREDLDRALVEGSVVASALAVLGSTNLAKWNFILGQRLRPEKGVAAALSTIEATPAWSARPRPVRIFRR